MSKTKGQKGILGVRKDPKNQMLFSFSVPQGEEWPSDDSEDSDYNPLDSDEEKSNKRRAPTSPRKKANPRKKIRRISSGSSSDTVEYNTQSYSVQREKKTINISKGKKDDYSVKVTDWGHGIPQIVLLKIFKYAVDFTGAIPFLCRVSKVNTLWNDTASHSSLWHKVDLSYGWIKSNDDTLKFLSSHKLQSTKEVNLSMWKKLTNSGLETLIDNCPLLEYLNLSHCSKLNSKATLYLADHGLKLTTLDLSYTSTDATSGKKLSYLIEKMGDRLQSLSVSGNILQGFNQTLSMLCHRSQNLRTLEVCNAKFQSDFISIDIEKMQIGCPKLKILRLTNSKFRPSTSIRNVSDGFPDLEELSVAVNQLNQGAALGINDSFISRILKGSINLKLLDLRACTGIKCSTIRDLIATDVQQLYLARSSIAKSPDIKGVITKWQHSLLELDVSWITSPADAVDKAVMGLCSNPEKSRLEVLDVSGSSVSHLAISNVLKSCLHLKSLDLTSCRDLPRGMKRKCTGKDLRHLKKESQKFRE